MAFKLYRKNQKETETDEERLEMLADYVEEPRVIYGKLMMVKVYRSQADKYINNWRGIKEAGPVKKS